MKIKIDKQGYKKMMIETVLSRSLRMMFASGAAVGLSLMAQPVMAQQAAPDAVMQRVEITGSSIKRIAKEGALPVQVLSQEDIKKSGATSATELIQNLPAMQGFVPSASSVNGGGGGATTAALHSLQSKYTLVLLDGQRMAPVALGSVQGGGFAVNIESIPLDAVERVEILTDGASALYGSDAIAGVVNFILKKNKTDGSAFVTANAPQHPGGKSYSAGISKGFGDLDKDKFNILMSYSHDEQKELAATQRSFSAQGAYFPFAWNGQNYIFDARTGNTEPANITFGTVPRGSPAGTDPTSVTINPYLTANGNCGGPKAGAQANAGCRFNYAATVQDIPSSKRDSGLLKGTLKLNETTTLWGELVLSRFSMIGQFAPSAQPFGINTTTRFPTLYNTYVQSYLDANNLDNPAGNATVGYRSVLLGGRADDFITDARHLSVGVNGDLMGWNYNSSLTLSHSQIKDNAAGGYSDFDQFSALIGAGTYDPIVGRGASSLQGALLNGTTFSKTTSNLNTFHVGAQHDLMALPGGTSIISLGGDYSKTHYQIGYSPLILSQSGFSTQPSSSDYPIGGNYGQVPFDASRNNYGLFGEWLLPISKTLEGTVSARYDNYGKTHSNFVFATAADPVTGLNQQLAPADLGNTSSAGTYKLSLRWTPTDNLLVRGAYGTGFKAPNISDIAGAVTFAGSTSGTYTCPFPGTAGCLPNGAQYDLLSGPNGGSGELGLKPEKSKQWTLGFVFEPVRGLSIGADLWNVQIKNQVLSSGIAEQVGFANPQTYKALFTNPYTDPAGFTTIAYSEVAINGGVANYRGVDWDVSYRNKSTPIGNLTVTSTGTYMLRQNYTSSPGGAVNTDLGIYGPDQAVVFKVQSTLMASLVNDKLTNTLAAHYKSGYKDAYYPAGSNIFLANADGTEGDPAALGTAEAGGIHVGSYTTVDWQAKYQFNQAFALSGGIKNLFDRDPPRTLQSGGGGNQIGYDGRYTDPLGRTFYLTAAYNFK